MKLEKKTRFSVSNSIINSKIKIARYNKKE